MAARTREVVWTESARDALEAVLNDVALTSVDGALRLLTRSIAVAASLATLADRGRVVPEVGDPALREVFVFAYRLMYRVHPGRVVIRAFLHGARDFARWRQEQVDDV